MGQLEGFVFGCIGGFLPELLDAFYKRHKKPPGYFKSPFYYITAGLMILAGGILVITYLRSGTELSPILSLNIGATAPLIIGAIKSNIPELEPGKSD